MTLTLNNLLFCMAVGAGGGLLGGFLGIGGSLVMIPAMSLWFGREGQHLYQAAAMIVNLFVALAAVIRHRRAGAVRGDALKGMIPSALVAIIIGVFVSNVIRGEALARLFALFLAYVIFVNVRKLIQKWRPPATATPDQAASDGEPNRTVTLPRSVFVGSVMGFMAGLLGIGGGGVAVPLQQIVYRIPLRQCIGTSTAVICMTAGIGALVKNMTLSEIDSVQSFSFSQSLALATALIPGAVIGSFIGANLTHKLSTTWVRLVFILLMAAAAARMSGLWA